MKFLFTPTGTSTAIPLQDFGVLQLLSQSSAVEGNPEAPNRRKVTIRLRLDFFEQTYRDNYSLVDQVRSALRRPHGTFQWVEEGSGAVDYLNRTVTIGDDDLPEDPNAWGTYRQAFSFSIWYWDHLSATESGTLGGTYQRTGVGTPVKTLREVENFSERYTTTLFDEMRTQRRRVAGQVSLSGRFQGDTTTPIADREAALQAQKDALLVEFASGSSGRLVYGTFDRIVRIIDFDAQINQPKNFIAFTLSASYTRFPNESDYSLCEFKIGRKENKMEGTVSILFNGTIGAPTLDMAQAKLASLQAALIPGTSGGIGYVLVSEDQDDARVSVSSKTSGVEGGDGETFIQLTFNQEWRKTTGDILEWNLKVSDAEDVKAGYLRTTYAGAVVAKAGSIATATATAMAKAAELGAGKHAFLVNSNLTPDEKLFQTSGGVVFVHLDFSYEYQRKGAKIFLEVTSESAVETFGQNVETVSGFVMAPTLAAALAVYTTDVRNVAANTGLLIRNERKPSLAQERTLVGTGSASTQDARFTFSLTLHRPKAAGETSMAYTLEPVSNIQAREKTTTVTGSVYATDEATATAFLDAFLGTATFTALGKKTESRRRTDNEQGNGVGSAAKVGTFLKLDFTEVYVGTLTGVDGILQCEVTLDIQYSGDRLVEKPLPDGPSVIQKCGITVGTRTVTGSVTATTAAACQAYARKARLQMGPGTYEQPVRISTVHRFLPQIDGNFDGAGANVQLYTAQFNFAELVPELIFTP